MSNELIKDNSDRRYLQIEDPFIMDDLRQMENAQNYNKWLYSLVKPYLGKRVLEIGPGIGNISRQLMENVDTLVGVEPNQFCVGILSNFFQNNPNFHLIQKTVEELSLDDLKKFAFDTILCMNVLEHIEDDASILSQFEKILEPGGRVVLLVPAFPQAYGPIDQAVGHFRRYTKSSMREVLKRTSMKIEALFYSNIIGLLGWTYNARVRKLTRQDDAQIRLFNKLVPFLSFIESKVRIPMGQSLIVVTKVVR
jgi:2-polyprenyl-3-methyl-5-hydroxy-6-metoxy-1,4-benzoquinol methylase